MRKFILIISSLFIYQLYSAENTFGKFQFYKDRVLFSYDLDAIGANARLIDIKNKIANDLNIQNSEGLVIIKSTYENYETIREALSDEMTIENFVRECNFTGIILILPPDMHVEDIYCRIYQDFGVNWLNEI